jgi:hypothetical protein
MALLMIMTGCLLVYAALEYRIRTALKTHGGTFRDQKGKPTQTPTARWVFHAFVGIHGLFIPQQGLSVLNLTAEPLCLLQLLGARYAWFYRCIFPKIRASVRNVGSSIPPKGAPCKSPWVLRLKVLRPGNSAITPLSRDGKSSEQFPCCKRRYHEMQAEWGRPGIVPAMKSDTNQEEAI